MKVSQIFKLFDSVADDYSVIFKTPDHKLVPLHFHVTEVASVQKKFVDCGGIEREESYASIQLWTADDYEHRITAGKLRKIILNNLIQTDNDMDLFVECDDNSLTTYTIENFEIKGKTISFLLGKKVTQCLASDKCGIKETPKKSCCQGKCC